MVWQVSGTVLSEDFADDPMARGWRCFGDAALFAWNPTNQNLEVTWDSRRGNSYFFHSLGTLLGRSDDFSLEFDVTLRDIEVGVTEGQPYTFEIAVGFLNLGHATNAGFARGTALQSPNLVEFDYFADSGYGATVSPTVVSRTGQFRTSMSFPFELTPGDGFHVRLTFQAANQTLKTTMTKNGAAFGPIKDVKLPVSFGDFRLDAVAVSSYSDRGAGGSILAHGTVDNLVVTVPDPPVGRWLSATSNTAPSIQFESRTNWYYRLERSDNWRDWTPVSARIAGDGGNQVLVDTNAPASKAYYRICAERP